MPFDPNVTTFKQVSNRLGKIDAHLKKLSRFMASVNWKKVPRQRVDDGHTEPGNKPPPWPPR